MADATKGAVRVYSIGHSTRAVDEFIGLLRAHGVATVVDVRTVPRSRHTPQFNGDVLPGTLAEAGMAYAHLKDLGGWRRPIGEASPNKGWRNDSFRGFADYMSTPEFAAGIEALLALAEAGPVALMCAEAVPWRCHRSLIADALLVRGVQVMHILGDADVRPHELTSFARVDGLAIAYPPAAEDGQP